MKKLILLITLTAMSIGSYAQDEQITEAERIVDKYTGKAGDAIKELATALEQPAEHVYAILVRQSLSEGILFTIGGVVLLIAGFWIIKLSMSVNKVKDSYRDMVYPDYKYVLSVSGSLILVLSFIILIASPLRILNPEYYAIKEIMDVFK